MPSSSDAEVKRLLKEIMEGPPLPDFSTTGSNSNVIYHDGNVTFRSGPRYIDMPPDALALYYEIFPEDKEE